MKKGLKWFWRNAHWFFLIAVIIATVCMDVYVAGNLLDSEKRGRGNFV